MEKHRSTFNPPVSTNERRGKRRTDDGMNKGRWTDSDLQQLSQAIAQQRGTIKYGSAYTLNIDWNAVSAYIGNRSVSACINKYQKLNFAKQKVAKEKVIDEITECHKCGKKVNGIKGLAGHSKFCKKFSKTTSTDSIFESITQNDSTKTKNFIHSNKQTSNDSNTTSVDYHVRYVTGNKKNQCKNNCPCKIKEIVMKGGLDLVLSYASKIEGVQASNSGDYFKTTNGNLYVQNLKKLKNVVKLCHCTRIVIIVNSDYF